MIISFFGHSKITNKEDIKDNLYSLIKSNAYGKVDFYLGGYGDFDQIAVKSCLRYKEENHDCSLNFITPYLDKNYIDKKTIEKHYDEIIFPPLEKTPQKYAIIERNKWIVENSSLIIFYIDFPFGGAYKTYCFAIKKNKKIFNIGHFIV